MPLLQHDNGHLYRALELARAAAAFASPNPAVGCVLTRGGQGEVLVGEGAHRYDLRDHAEVVALKDAAARGESPRGATAYVTLEPCSHFGRTGPCADALIAAGIARAVVATVDPNPLVRGQGLARMRAAGVEVVLADPASELARAARRLNDAFAFSIQHGRPFLTLKAAVSADGKLAPAPSQRSARAPHWLTGPAARADVQQLRHETDVLLTGIGTVLADDPTLTDRTGLPRRRPLLRAVLDADLRTPTDSALARTAKGDLLLFAALGASAAREASLRQAGAEVVRVPSTRGVLAVDQVLSHLFALSMRSVLLEGGSTLNGTFLMQDLIDKLILYRASAPLGPEALPFAHGYPGPEPVLERLSAVAHQAFPHGDGEDFRTTGYLHDPWAGI